MYNSFLTFSQHFICPEPLQFVWTVFDIKWFFEEIHLSYTLHIYLIQKTSSSTLC